MGIFGALSTAVAGLRAQAFALENISGNIANSRTTAFKRMDTSFEDLIPDASASKQLAGSVVATIVLVYAGGHLVPAVNGSLPFLQLGGAADAVRSISLATLASSVVALGACSLLVRLPR